MIFKDEEEIALESLIFGDKFQQNNQTKKESSINNKPDDELFIIDSTTQNKAKRNSLWIDNDDSTLRIDISSKNIQRKLRKHENETFISGLEYQDRLKSQFEKIYSIPKWAKLNPLNENQNDDVIDPFKLSLGIQIKSKNVMNSDFIDIIRCVDGNMDSYSNCVIQSCQFHPTAPVLITSGLDKSLKIFKIDGNSNYKMFSILIKDLPIYKSLFTFDGKQIILSGRRKHFYVYDIETQSIERIANIKGCDEKSLERMFISCCNSFICFIGNNGNIILVSRSSKQWVCNLKMNSNVVDITFSSCGLYCYSLGDSGEIVQWDMKTLRCIRKVYDHGAVNCTKISISPNSEYLAIGSKSGIVSIYATKSCFSHSTLDPFRIEPFKVIKNLVTCIHLLKDALRIIHIPSFHVYSNWPTVKTPLGMINAIDFSSQGGFIAIGNDKGKVLMYKLSAFIE